MNDFAHLGVSDFLKQLLKLVYELRADGGSWSMPSTISSSWACNSTAKNFETILKEKLHIYVFMVQGESNKFRVRNKRATAMVSSRRPIAELMLVV